MNITMMNARTVSLVKELTTETRHGANGDFESKYLLMQVAVDRNYRNSSVVNGKVVMDYPTDFFLVKAVGKVAETLSQYCTAKKSDGKLISRHLLMSGSFETYKKDVVEDVEIPNVNIQGALYNVKGSTTLKNRTHYIFIIDNFIFLDKNPNSQNQQNQQGSAVPSAAPVAAPMAAGQIPQQFLQQFVQQGAPVMAGQPTQQEVYAAQTAPQGAPQGGFIMTGQVPASDAAPAPASAPVAAAPVAAPNAPTVGQNFVNNGGTAPF